MSAVLIVALVVIYVTFGVALCRWMARDPLEEPDIATYIGGGFVILFGPAVVVAFSPILLLAALGFVVIRLIPISQEPPNAE